MVGFEVIDAYRSALDEGDGFSAVDGADLGQGLFGEVATFVGAGSSPTPSDPSARDVSVRSTDLEDRVPVPRLRHVPGGAFGCNRHAAASTSQPAVSGETLPDRHRNRRRTAAHSASTPHARSPAEARPRSCTRIAQSRSGSGLRHIDTGGAPGIRDTAYGARPPVHGQGLNGSPRCAVRLGHHPCAVAETLEGRNVA